MQFLTHLAESLIHLGLGGIFVGMVLESAAIPIPSEVILPFAGYLVLIGRTTWLAAGFTALLGGTLGAVISYGVAFYGGRPLFQHWARGHELSRAEAWFQRYGDGAVLVGRLVPGVRTFISLPAGLAKMPFGRFVLYSVLGALPWTVIFMYLGYVGGQHWTQITQHDALIYAVGLLLVLAWLVWFLKKRQRRA